MSNKIMALHPDASKQGTNIDLEKYEIIKGQIIAVLREQQGISHFELDSRVKDALIGIFDGSIGWYVSTIKLDLEARGILEINRKTSPQRITLRHF